VARYGEAAPYLDEISVTWGRGALGRGPTGTAIRTGHVRLARDLVVEPSYEPWRASAARQGLESSLSLPLLKDDVAFGALMVYAPEPDAFGDTETEILVELVDNLAFGIRTLRERSERDRLATAVEQVAESVIITDADARITYVNPAFERVTGYTRDEVMGKNPRILKSGLHMPWFYDSMWASLTNRLTWVADLVNRRKDGTLFTEETVISPIRDPSGAITSYVAVKRDVTRERALEERSSHLARERALIAETIRGLSAGDTPEATAQAICRRVVSLASAMAAQLFLFGLDGRAVPIGFVVEGQSDPPLRGLPDQLSRHLRERSAEGPWIEPWVSRPSNPYNQPLIGLGIHAIACAPVRHEQLLIGLLVTFAAGSVEEAAVTEALPALVEFADLAGALIGRNVAERTEAGRGRDHIADVISRRAFRPVFQPIVELASNEIVGYEALTRFTDGANPEVIFTDASAVGLGVELEMATLQTALAAAEALPPSAWLNLNASPELIVAGEPLRSLLAGSSRRIVLEVTEHAAIADYPAFRAAMDTFGPEVEFAVDDAGTGFASLRHIVELHPAFVKLDRSLMAGLESDDARQAMIVGLSHFAHVTGCRLIVEGIETDSELTVLRALTIELGQGYLLGRPLPVDAA
jgi:PAS domain S-box-containing protein